MEDNKRELSLEEMDKVSGGKGGSPDMLPEKEGFWVYQIQSGDCLKNIAKRFGTSTKQLMHSNPTIFMECDITAGYYIYVPE